jgi:FkbM family methyltransferase
MNARPIIDAIKSCVRIFGCDVVMYRPCLEVIQSRQFDLVLDVGANEGQFGRELRKSGYIGKIISFEPVKEAFDVLKERADKDGSWECHNMALGRQNGSALINVHEDSRLSSFLQHKDLSSRQTTVVMRRLDDFLAEFASVPGKIFLKLDTQGFEMEILEGVGSWWDRISGALVELSIEPLYDGQVPIEKMIARLKLHGLLLWSLRRGCYDMATMRDLEADGLFLRKESHDGRQSSR